MTLSEKRRYLIRRSYFMPGSTFEISLAMRSLWGWTVTEAEIKTEWADRAQNDPLFCQARPEFGFKQDDKTRLAERLVA